LQWQPSAFASVEQRIDAATDITNTNSKIDEVKNTTNSQQIHKLYHTNSQQIHKLYHTNSQQIHKLYHTNTQQIHKLYHTCHRYHCASCARDPNHQPAPSCSPQRPPQHQQNHSFATQQSHRAAPNRQTSGMAPAALVETKPLH
jgi:DNA polymerase elongation subunit (family B)